MLNIEYIFIFHPEILYSDKSVRFLYIKITFSINAHAAIYHDGWRAVCPWPGTSFSEAAKKDRRFGTPIPNQVLVDIETHDWELYHIEADYSETHNLAAERRDKLIEMIGRWWAEAGKYQVLPIDGSSLQRLNVRTPDHRQTAG